MSSSSFDNLFNKVKGATRQAADQTNRAARHAKLKMTIMSLQSEKLRHFQMIGMATFMFYAEKKKIDGDILQGKIQEELRQVERIDQKIAELEAEINAPSEQNQTPDDLESKSPEAKSTEKKAEKADMTKIGRAHV